MPEKFHWILAAVLCCGLVALPSRAGAESSAASTVIMISLDGTRPVDVHRDTTPSLVALAHRGVRAVGVIPAQPSNTFPSHVTLVTGVAPERHGIVNNDFIDPERGRFEKREIPSWIDVEPLWSLLERHGVVSASYHWVGSEGPWTSGRGPRHWFPFSSRTREDTKVEQLLAWLDIVDPEERPRFVTAWFHGADHAGHLSGPGSAATVEALGRQEPSIAALVQGLDQRNLWGSTTLIFVSDHGMVAARNRVDLGRELAQAGVEAKVLGGGGFAQVHLESRAQSPASRAPIEPASDAGLDATQIARVIEIARGLGLEAWARDEAPTGWGVANPRFGDVVVRAPLGTAIHRRGLPKGGFHGYPPELPEMHGMLIAAGRGVVPGSSLPTVSSLQIAPSILALLGVETPSWMEAEPLAALLDGIEPVGASSPSSATLVRPEPAASQED